MPIYEYKCQSCKKEFEIIRPMSDKDKKIECEKCGSKKVKRKLTVANAQSGGKALAGSSSSCNCGSCSGNCGSCGN
jgi:putative FmdB family regulatory protein